MSSIVSPIGAGLDDTRSPWIETEPRHGGRVARRVRAAPFVFGYLVSWWILRKVPSAPVLHGALIGIVATAMYLGLVFAQPGGFAAAVGTYGVPLFWFSQAMRIAGCVAGAARNPKPAAPSFS